MALLVALVFGLPGLDWSTPRDHTELFAGVMSITSGEIQEKTLDSVALKLGEI